MMHCRGSVGHTVPTIQIGNLIVIIHGYYKSWKVIQITDRKS